MFRYRIRCKSTIANGPSWTHWAARRVRSASVAAALGWRSAGTTKRTGALCNARVTVPRGNRRLLPPEPLKAATSPAREPALRAEGRERTCRPRLVLNTAWHIELLPKSYTRIRVRIEGATESGDEFRDEFGESRGVTGRSSHVKSPLACPAFPGSFGSSPISHPIPSDPQIGGGGCFRRRSARWPRR